MPANDVVECRQNHGPRRFRVHEGEVARRQETVAGTVREGGPRPDDHVQPTAKRVGGNVDVHRDAETYIPCFGNAGEMAAMLRRERDDRSDVVLAGVDGHGFCQKTAEAEADDDGRLLVREQRFALGDHPPHHLDFIRPIEIKAIDDRNLRLGKPTAQIRNPVGPIAGRIGAERAGQAEKAQTARTLTDDLRADATMSRLGKHAPDQRLQQIAVSYPNNLQTRPSLHESCDMSRNANERHIKAAIVIMSARSRSVSDGIGTGGDHLKLAANIKG